MGSNTEWRIVAFKFDGFRKLRLDARTVSPHIQQVRWVGRSRQNTKPYFAVHRFWSRSLRDRKKLYGLAVMIDSDGLHRFNLPVFRCFATQGKSGKS
jgi:hypothetical protein